MALSPEFGDRFRQALVTGWVDRICLARDRETAGSMPGAPSYVMVGGEPLVLARSSVVCSALPEVLVAVRVAGAWRAREVSSGVQSREVIRMATIVDRSWLEVLFAERITTHVEVSFDADKERVVASQITRFDGLMWEQRYVSVAEHAPDGDVARMLARAASEDLVRALGLDKEGRQWLERVAFLREAMPELGLPDLRPVADDRAPEAIEALSRWCWGKRSFQDIKREVDVVALLRGVLTREQWGALEREAPSHVQVPSGSRVRIDYAPSEGPPVLAARIQEMFGWDEGPRVAGGRVALMLHLLAPNYRPAQITQDLASFWRNTYPEVRRELRARYAKHRWPEDPLSAIAIKKR